MGMRGTIGEESPRRISIAVLLFLGCLAFFSYKLGERPFYTRGESREALVVAAMRDRQDYILPKRNEVVPSKPPMFHWMAAAAAGVTGALTEAAIRFPSALCAALTATILFLFTAYTAGVARGLAAAFVLITSFEWVRSATHARVDMCFTFWLTAAALSVFHALQRSRREGSGAAGWFAVAAVCSAGAVLAKGPAGLMLPWLIAGVFVLLQGKGAVREFWTKRTVRSSLIAIAASTCIAGCWYLLAFYRLGWEFVEVQLLQENLGRVLPVGSGTRGHGKPSLFSIINLCVAFLPWSLLFPLFGAALWRMRSRLVTEEPARLFCLAWVLCFLAVVTISHSKREVYFLPAFPALAYLVSSLLMTPETSAASPAAGRRLSAVMLSVAALLLIGALTLLAVPGLFGGAPDLIALARFAERPAEAAAAIELLLSSRMFLLFSGFGAVLLSCSAGALWRGKILFSGSFLAGAVLFLASGLNWGMLPALSALKTPREFMQTVNEALPPETLLYRYKFDLYSATFYAQRYLPQITDFSELPPGTELHMLVRSDMLPEVDAALAEEEVLLRSTTFAADGHGQLLLVRGKTADVFTLSNHR